MSDPFEPPAPAWVAGPKPPPDDDDDSLGRRHRHEDEPVPYIRRHPDGDGEFGIVPGGDSGGDHRERGDDDL